MNSYRGYLTRQKIIKPSMQTACSDTLFRKRLYRRRRSSCRAGTLASRQAELRGLIEKEYFGFDCVCLVKGILWGWNGDASKKYGGAVYQSNGVPDITEGQMINACNGVSSDFSKLVPGEFLWMQGHCGVYIGDGLAVECTPKWDNCVQITAVGNLGSKSGYNSRTMEQARKAAVCGIRTGGTRNRCWRLGENCIGCRILRRRGNAGMG